MKRRTGADALVFPSLYEDLKLPVLEGMAVGVFVHASDRASLPKVEGDGASYFDPTSSQGSPETDLSCAPRR